MDVKSNRFVVFLDIMGFKERVARNSADDLYKELTAFNRDIANIVSDVTGAGSSPTPKQEDVSKQLPVSKSEANKEVLLSQFSDSIILFSGDNSSNSLETISKVASAIMLSAIDREKPIPLKGALAEGYVTCDQVKQLFFGQALIDAFLLEENVQYYGIVVHHSAEASVKKLDSELFRNNTIPLKSGLIEHFEVKWWDSKVNEALEGLERIRLTVSDSPRKYVDNTKTAVKK